MKLNPLALAIISTLSFALALVLYINNQQPLPSCIQTLKTKAEKAEQKMVMQNDDGGLFLLTNSDVPGLVQVLGFIGPKSLESVVSQMENSGLVNISMKLGEECVVESGLIYTLVSGSYEIPTPPSESL
jgi:hypothetical protein